MVLVLIENLAHYCADDSWFLLEALTTSSKRLLVTRACFVLVLSLVDLPFILGVLRAARFSGAVGPLVFSEGQVLAVGLFEGGRITSVAKTPLTG